jgi:cobalt transporter subunit CbtB
MNAHTAAASIAKTGARTETLTAAVVAFMVGSIILFAVGFAHPSTLHNAAHDTRHGLSFPCH